MRRITSNYCSILSAGKPSLKKENTLFKFEIFVGKNSTESASHASTLCSKRFQCKLPLEYIYIYI